jgi:hypothetical protein
MRRTGFALMVAGAIAVSSAYLIHKDKFSSDAIFQRQRPAIERIAIKNDELGEKRYRQLRTGLARVEKGTIPEKCRFEKVFQGKLENGSEEKAIELELRENYRPHPECDATQQIEDASKQWHGWMGLGGIAGFLAGALVFIGSFRKRVKVPEL